MDRSPCREGAIMIAGPEERVADSEQRIDVIWTIGEDMTLAYFTFLKIVPSEI